MTVDAVNEFFARLDKTVVTFAGYSGSEYEDSTAMLGHAQSILDAYDPETTIVNSGATAAGIGAVYALAKRAGFITTGIVSSLAGETNAEISPHVDHVFRVEDSTWGGFDESGRLSPTSRAMVLNTDVMVGIGGGAVARDEMIEARRMGKKTIFIPADHNHELAIEKATRKGHPEPTDFRGEAHAVFGP